MSWRPRLAAEMDNLRAAAGWALDAPDVDDAAVGVAILGGLAGEALTGRRQGFPRGPPLGWRARDELDAAHRPLLLGVAAYDRVPVGRHRAGRDAERGCHRRIGDVHPGACRCVHRGRCVGLGRRDAAGAMAALARAARLDTSGSPMPNSGSAMNYDEIVAYALDKLDRLTTP